jgi:threonine/homoserine/homoserine lactone efflux protein
VVLWLLIKGLLAGMAIAAPVGPVNVLCASRTLAKGRISGFLSGLGAATADGFYGGIAAFSITLVIDFLRREEFYIRVIGGILLLMIGLFYFFKPAKSLEKSSGNGSNQSDYTSTLLLTLTNPTTVLSFIAVLASMGVGEPRAWWLSFFLMLGIFAGSMLWWIILVLLVNRLRHRFNQTAICWMNRIAGIAIGAFGIITFAIGVTSRK